MKPRLTFQVVSEADAVSVAVFNLEVTATVWLVADIAHDPHALRLKLSVQRVGIVDPNVAVPRPALGINDAVGAHRAGGSELGQHDDDAAALNHAKRRRVVPKTLIMEAELVPVVICGADDIVYDEVRSNAPAEGLHDVGHFRVIMRPWLAAKVRARRLTDRA